MKKSLTFTLVAALALGAAGAFLVFEETTGLGKAHRPLQGIPMTPQQKGGVPFRQRGIFPDEPTRPLRLAPPPPPAPPVRVSPAAEERELDDTGDWEFQEMEEVAPRNGKPAVQERNGQPGPGAPNRPRLGPEQKFESKDQP